MVDRVLYCYRAHFDEVIPSQDVLLEEFYQTINRNFGHGLNSGGRLVYFVHDSNSLTAFIPEDGSNYNYQIRVHPRAGDHRTLGERVRDLTSLWAKGDYSRVGVVYLASLEVSFIDSCISTGLTPSWIGSINLDRLFEDNHKK